MFANVVVHFTRWDREDGTDLVGLVDETGENMSQDWSDVPSYPLIRQGGVDELWRFRGQPWVHPPFGKTYRRCGNAFEGGHRILTVEGKRI